MNQSVVGRSQLIQGVIAILAGGFGWGIGQVFVDMIVQFIIHNVLESAAWRLDGPSWYITDTIPTLIIVVVGSAISAAAGAVLIVLVMRLLGLSVSRLVAMKVIIISIIFYALRSLALLNIFQTVSQLVSFLTFVLPFALVWIGVYRGGPLDRPLRKA